MSWLQSLFCKHNWQWSRNIYGDEIISAGWKRSWWYCCKCGKTSLRTALHPEPQPSSGPGRSDE